MDKLINAIKTTIPIVIKEWNEKKIQQFEILVEQKFKEYFLNRETQEKTKMISPIIDILFSRIMSETISDFNIDEGRGRDYKWGEMPIESKTTFNIGNSWTGNGYKKTDNHILSKFELDENGVIVSYFTCFVNLNTCVSAWSKPKNSNFSTLKFLNDDLDKIILIHGSMCKSQKFLSCGLIK